MTFPKIIYGTAWKEGKTTALVVQAVLQGFRAIDTACQPKHYQEALVGEALQILYDEHGLKREELFLQTKYTPYGGQDPNKPLPYSPTKPIKEQVADSFQVSLRNLRTSYLDSYILHSPLSTPEQTLEAWTVLTTLQDEGHVRLIGLSNTYHVSTLEYLHKHSGRKVQVVQNRWYERNSWDIDVVRFCKKEGIHYEPFWTLTGSPSLFNHPATTALAAKKKCTNGQIVYRLAQHWGLTPLSGTKTEVRMKEAVSTEKIELSDEEVPQELRAIMRY